MTLVLRAATLADVSDRQSRHLGAVEIEPGANVSDNMAVSTSRLILDVAAGQRVVPTQPNTFDQSGYSRLRGDVGGMLYQKPLPVAVRRSPRRILIVDDFEASALKWAQLGATVSRTTTANEFWDGVAAMKMVTGVVPAVRTLAGKYWGYQGLQKYVVELWWSWSAAADTTPRRFGIELILGDGTNIHYLGVAYTKNETTPQNKWQYTADGVTFSDVTGGAETLAVDAAAPYTWHYLRAHFNMSTATPTLSELHTDTLDLTGLSHAGAASADARIRNEIDLVLWTDAAAATTAYVDDVVVSDAEA
jgi:hypothetical protein